MQIAPVISRTNFKSSSAKTEEGNTYEKSNAGKLFLIPLGALDLPKLFCSDTRTKVLGVTGFAVTSLIGCFIDSKINKTRAEDADLFAKTNDVSDDTSKGKKVGALSMAAYSGIVTPLLFKPYRNILGVIGGAISGAIVGTLFGHIYDNRVNKFHNDLLRNALSQQNDSNN